MNHGILKNKAILALGKKGFTLLETGVALGIAALLLLALAQYSLFNSRSQKSNDLSGEFNDIAGTVGKALANQATCSAVLTSITTQMPAVGASPTVSVLPGINYGTSSAAPAILVSGTQPSGLIINPIILTAAPVTAPLNANQGVLNVTISATKGGPSPTPSFVSSVNSIFVGGNSTYTKTFSVGVWTDATNNIVRCIESQDMGQATPVPLPSYSQPAPSMNCLSAARPNCENVQCCNGIANQAPYWMCPANGWSSCS
jgi:type II secretory pathway pseudopilin PulG